MRAIFLFAVLTVAAATLVALPSSTGAHPGEAHGIGVGKTAAGGMFASFASDRQVAAVERLFTVNTPRQAPTPAGPCTKQAAASMPVGEAHDHADIAAHAMRCRIEQVAFLPLKDELASRDNVILGEMDVKADIAAVAITYPQAGVLFFDVSDPAKPKFLSKYSGTECDQLVIDINCGAFVDLSADGKTAYMSVQKLTFLPTVPPDPNAIVQSGPGVDVIDISDPKNPRLAQPYLIAGEGGIHTTRSHTIPEGPSSEDEPRAPGEYLISNQNGFGVDIARVDRAGGSPFLTTIRRTNRTDPEASIVINEVHDTLIENDPIDGRTYLYIAAGFQTGFLVYDITDPEQPELKAEWDLTPECEEDWYSHTIDIAYRGDKRYVTMPSEMFLQKDPNTASGLAEMSDEDKADGCGTFVGNGDKPGPLWIVDASDFSKLGPADDIKSSADAEETDDELKRASEQALVATWTNPANRAGGSLTFSPHNQEIVGDKIYLSHYHGGVYVLDASAAFAGKRERPSELGFIVPSGQPTRPLLGQPALTGIAGRFFTDFPLGRPEIWDMVPYKKHILAADMTGGFYSFQYEGDKRGGAGASCADRTAPRVRTGRARLKLTRRSVRLRGRAQDRGCAATASLRARQGKLRRVKVAVARQAGRRCRHLNLKAGGRFSKARSCAKPRYFKARGLRKWSFKFGATLPAGRYQVSVVATDRAGNASKRRVLRRTLR